MRSFATLIQQSEELGSSITEALRVYSEDMRHKRLSAAEEKAYALLRTKAMNENKKIVEIAQSVLTAAELLK